MTRGFWTALLLAVLAPAAVAAALAPPDAGEADASEAWVEQEVNPPAFPKPDGLVELRAGGLGGNRFLIDADTLSIGSDGVVRYVLVVRSSAGAENVSFEGIHCKTREQKYYAFLQRNGTWSKAREPQWRFIEAKEVNRHHAVLFADILCTQGSLPPRAVRDVVQRLRYGNL